MRESMVYLSVSRDAHSEGVPVICLMTGTIFVSVLLNVASISFPTNADTDLGIYYRPSE